MIDAHDGKDSLADTPNIQAAVRVLDHRGSVTAYGTGQTQSLSYMTEFFEESRVEDGPNWPPKEGEPILRPYEFLMTGGSFDGHGEFLWIVLVHESSELAKENARILPERVRTAAGPFRARNRAEFEIETIETEGRLIIATIRGMGVRALGYDFPDPMLLHEDPE